MQGLFNFLTYKSVFKIITNYYLCKMLRHFTEYLHKQLNIEANDRILLTISGGIDSVVMLDLFSRVHSNIGIAHCNFKLRDKDSDADVHFVSKLADHYKAEFYSRSFDTQDYAESKGISVQMAARDLRYQWFEEIREKHNYKYIATAHHMDDQVETFFINMFRGTGLSGIRGMKAKTGHIIRPLLFTDRKSIESYLLTNGLTYREDSSNASDKYLRNKIRSSPEHNNQQSSLSKTENF